MTRPPFPSRREFLSRASLLAVSPWLSRCVPPEPPRRFGAEPSHGFLTSASRQADGTWLRTFSGRAAPDNLEVVEAGQ